MNHQELSELYELYALGLLEPEERIELERHLAEDCVQCRDGVKKGLALGALMGALPERLDPPRRLRARVLASIGVESKSSRLWLAGLAFACACLLIGLVLVNFEGSRWKGELASAESELRASQADLARSRAALEFLNEPETQQVGFGGNQPLPPHGHIAVNGKHGVLLMASNLPQAPAGKIYEMWLVPKKGAAIPAGLFQSDTRGNVLYLRPDAVDVANTKAVAVTVEPAAGSPAPTTTPLIAAGLTE